MPDKNADISFYSAAELLRYAKGQMSPAEMYALEKAAMEDPFLAEALEGYIEAVAQQPSERLAEQADRINTITPEKQKAPVVPLWQRKAIQIAVAACFIAGAGWILFSVLQKTQSPDKEVASVQKTTPAIPTPDDGSTNRLGADSAMAYQPIIRDSQFKSPMAVTQDEESAKKPALAPGSSSSQQTVAAAPAAAYTETNPTADKARIPQADSVAVSTGAISREMAALSKKEDRAAAMRQMVAAPRHIFKGRITDAANNPLPYANIMVEGQNFGTYSDLSGNFNFISDDSVLPVRVRSVGYLNQTIALKEGKQETRIILQQDKQLNDNLPLTVQQNTRPILPSAKSIIEKDSISGAELTGINVPYYDIYLLNNNRVSPQPVLNRQVQLSFDISKEGEATNITVIQSSGKALDEEAIRLIKEGPKLNPSNSTGTRKKVTVRF